MRLEGTSLRPTRASSVASLSFSSGPPRACSVGLHCQGMREVPKVDFCRAAQHRKG